MKKHTLSRRTGTLGGQISRRIALLSLIAILALLIAIGLGLWGTLQGVQRQLEDAGTSTAQDFDNFIGNIRTDLQATSDLLATSQDTHSVLRRALERQPAIFEILLVNDAGQVQDQRRRIGRGPLRLQEQPWLATVQNGNSFISPVSYQEFGVPFVNLAVPVSDEIDAFRATLVARVDLTALWDSIIRQRVGETGYVLVVAENGELLAYQDLQLVQQGVPLQELTGRSPELIAQSILEIHRGVSGKLVIATGVPLEETPWYAVVEQPVLEALGSFLLMALALLGILIAIGFLVRNIVFFARQRIAEPLGKLHAGVTSLTAGDLSQRINVKSQDELGDLAGAFNLMSDRLQEMIGSLEHRVEERTQDLAHRRIQLEAAAQIAREAAAIRDIDRLLDTTVQLISQHFGFYHAGIFLINELREHALLRAASSEGGQRMLARSHKLRVGQVGIVGHVAGHGEPRIAQTVASDATFFDNPDLPLTRSEIALPLKVRGLVIGVLDVQSTQETAFADDDVAILQTMADQVALAIENANLLAESQLVVSELETLYGRQAQESWRGRAAKSITAYHYDSIRVEPAPADMLSDREMVPQTAAGNGRLLVVPIQVHGQDLGAIRLTREPDQPAWSENDLTMVKAVSAQVTLSLESAQLLEQTQNRAAREQMVSEVAAHMRETLDIDTVLQTAVAEMRQVLDLQDVTIRLGTSNEIPSKQQREGGR